MPGLTGPQARDVFTQRGDGDLPLEGAWLVGLAVFRDQDQQALQGDEAKQQQADDDLGPPGAEGAVEVDVGLDQPLDQHPEQGAEDGAHPPLSRVPPITTAAMASSSTPTAASG